VTYRLVVNFRPAFFSAATLTIIAHEEARVRLTIATMGSKWTYEGILDARSTRDLHDLIVAVLETRGRSDFWNEAGLDGVTISGSFKSLTRALQEFEAWSPSVGTPPYWLVSAALECVPLRHDDRPGFELALEGLRQCLGIGVPLRWTWGNPPCLRVLGSLPALSHWRSALSLVPQTGDLTIDLRNIEFVHTVSQEYIADLKRLVGRRPPIKWVIGRSSHLEELVKTLAIPRECIAWHT